MTISSPIAVIDASGITVPLFTDVLDYWQSQYRSIYGQDVDLDPDTQDGQWVAIMAAACNDANLTIEATYQSYSPTYAQGVGLSSVVKINGIRRQIPSNSSCAVIAVGIAGTDISGTVIGDGLNLNTQWLLPGALGSGAVIIPPEGQITTTAGCLATGAIQAAPGTLNKILTPVPGWQTVNNAVAASPGEPLESDAQLRRRQTFSVANPSQTVVEGIQGAIASVNGVTRTVVYENPTAVADVNGIPAFSMAAVVEGGAVADIANAIALRKTPGSPTYGTTRVLVVDARGLPSYINFFVLTQASINVIVNITAFIGFNTVIENNIVNSIVDWITSLPIGYDVLLTQTIAATILSDGTELTYEVTSVQQSRGAGTPSSADIVIAYTEAAFTTAANITLNVTGGSVSGRRLPPTQPQPLRRGRR